MGYSTLKAALDAVVRTNGHQQITGANLNGVMTTILQGVDILDRANPADTSGLNKVVLDKSKTFAEQVTGANTIYEIRDAFNLGGSVTIPAGCVLAFVGGSLKNGTIEGNGTGIVWNGVAIFDETTTLSGSFNSDLNPLMFGVGLSDATNYICLKKTYENARNIGRNVDWRGVPDFTIDVPANPSSIPLTEINDFCGVTITIKNTSARFALFRMVGGTQTDITINKSFLSDRNLNFSPTTLPTSACLLIVRDDNAWTYRTGSGDFFRKDLIFLNNKKAYNTAIQTYNNSYSSPSCKYVQVSTSPKVIKNLNVVRVSASTYITIPFVVEECFNVTLENLSFETESNTLVNDVVINLTNCHSCHLEKISMVGLFDYSGNAYGINLENCAFITIRKFNEQNENWGIMGTNNVNCLRLEDSNLNRLDLHCYGKNFYTKNCVFRDLYNQLTGGYGDFIFEECQFLLSIPYLSDGTFNAYTEFNLIFKNCEMKLAASNGLNAGNCLIYFNSFDATTNSRAELATKCLPNVLFQNCNVSCAGTMYMFKGIDASVTFHKTRKIAIDGMSVTGLAKNPISISDAVISIANNVDLSVNGLDIIQVEDSSIVEESYTYQVENSLNWHNIVGNTTLTIDISNSRLGIDYKLLQKHKINARNSVIRGIRGNSNMFPSKWENCQIYLTCKDDAAASIYEIPQLATFDRCHFVRANSEWACRVYRAGKTIWNECTKNSADAMLVNGLATAEELYGVKVSNGGLPPTWEMTYNTLGTTAQRPSLGSNWRAKYIDTTLNKMILWNGTAWVNMDGSALS